MTRFSLCLAFVVWSGAGFAQGLDARAERLLEEQLSGPGRVVEITGFAGAVSTRASFERLTMSDGQGVWLVLENAVLDWTASALLRGRLQVDELSATRLEVLRAPVSEIDPVASSEASGFRIPDLPVVIDIGRAELAEISLGAPVLGTPVVARFSASARLENGGLDVDLQAERLDDPGGQAEISLGFSPDTEALRINADIREPAGGVVVRALDIPGLPSLELRINGDGLLDDFASTLRLSTDGQERFGGRVTLAATEAAGRRFEADMSGDIRPLLAPDQRAFFGSDTDISAAGEAQADGAITLDTLLIETAQLRLIGEGAIGPDGAPQRFQLVGQVRGGLPSGAATLDAADLNVDFDISESPEWTFSVLAQSIGFPGGSLATADLQGRGVLQPGTPSPFAGEVTLAAQGLALEDRAISDAIGQQVTLRTGLSLSDTGSFALNDLQLDAAHLSASGNVEAEPTDGRLALTADLIAQVPDIGALGAVVAPVRAGDARVEIGFFTEMPGGATRVSVSGQTIGLDVGQAALTQLLEPETRLDLRVERDEAGTRIEGLMLENSALQLSGQGGLSTADGGFNFTGVLAEPQALLAGLPDGALRISGRASELTTNPSAELTVSHDTGTQANLTARLAENIAQFDVNLSAPDLTPFQALLGPVERGAAEANISGQADTRTGTVEARIDATTESLSIGIAELSPLLEPTTELSATVRRTQDGDMFFDPVTLSNAELSAQAEGLLTADGPQRVNLSAVLERPNLFLTDLPEGALRLSGQVSDLSGTPRANIELVHDTGTRADLSGQLAERVAQFDLALNVPSLAPFQSLLGPVERGAAEARIVGRANTETGTVQAQVDATTRSLSLGIAQLLPLIEPETTLSARVIRSETGEISFDPVTLNNVEVDARATGLLTPEGPERVDLNATFVRTSSLMRGLPDGALRVTARATDLSANARADVALSHDAGTQADLSAAMDGSTVRFEAQLDSASLAPFSQLLGPVRGGAASAQATGEAQLDTGAVTAQVSARTSGLETSIAQIAALVRPDTTLEANFERTGDGALILRSAELQNAQLDASGSARLGANGLESAALRAVLANLGVIVPQVPGQLDLTASLNENRLNAELSSATGAEARVLGQIGLPGNAVDLTTVGRAPLALASPFIGARSLTGSAAFDLAVRGTPGLNAVSGQITSGDLRFADPGLGFVLSPATARVDLSSGRAQINLQGALNDAPLEVRGGLALSAPFQTDLNLALRNLDYAYQDFARLNLSADLTLSGPAQQQLTVGGDVRLGRTEVRIPDGVGGADPLPPVRHVGAPALVRRTLDRAGLLGRDAEAGGGGPRIPLNLTVRALEPIFVRGRGLDAEFGGELEVRGTVANPVPTGQFSLRRGRFSLLGRRLDLTRGEITASGGLIPDLDILASAQAEGITAQVALSGPADAPEIVLTSQPELPQDEVLARLLFGRDVSSLSAFQVAQLVSSLAALTTGRPTLLDRSRRAFGVDDLDVRTDAATGEAELAIGNYISENIYSEVEIGAQGDTQINLNLDLTDNTRVRGSVNSEGGTGIGVFWERDY